MAINMLVQTFSHPALGDNYFQNPSLLKKVGSEIRTSIRKRVLYEGYGATEDGVAAKLAPNNKVGSMFPKDGKWPKSYKGTWHDFPKALVGGEPRGKAWLYFKEGYWELKAANAKARKKSQLSYCDYQYTGKMWKALSVQVVGKRVECYFKSKEEFDKAYFLNNERKKGSFFYLTHREWNAIQKVMFANLPEQFKKIYRKMKKLTTQKKPKVGYSTLWKEAIGGFGKNYQTSMVNATFGEFYSLANDY